MKKEYTSIVDNILTNEDFSNLKNERHHINTNRYQHSCRVSYISYWICKRLHLNYQSAARAGLMHDFFFDNNLMSKKQQLVNHPDKAVENAMKITTLSSIEKNIIMSHMYPIGHTKPACKEAIIVDMVDDAVSVKEFVCSLFTKATLVTNFIALIIINLIKM